MASKNVNTRNGKGKNSGKPNGGKAPYRGKNYGKGNKNQRRMEEVVDTAVKTSESNPLGLYTKWAEYARDAAKLPFALPVGAPANIEFSNGAINMYSPGLMTIHFSPAIGVSHDYTSPINRSSTRFYTAMRSQQKASAKYDHQDVTMMMLALDSCIMFHSMCKRAIGVAQDYTPVNTYYPDYLVAAMGFKLSDIRQNLQDFRMWVNTFAHNLEQYALPNNINLFDRHRWMCEGLYTDSKSVHAQTYMFVPIGFWQYDNTVSTGSQLTMKMWYDPSIAISNNQQHTVAEAMAFGDALINSIANDEDFAIISGDLYNLYSGNTFHLDYVSEDYKILPDYQEVVLSQIENAVVVGPFHEEYTPKITQNPNVNQGAIVYEPMVTNSNEIGACVITPTMNFHYDSPTPGDVIEATRMMAVLGKGTSNEGIWQFPVETCGTELVHSVEITTRVTSGSAGRYRLGRGQIYAVTSDQTAAQVTQRLTELTLLNRFDWAPQFYVTMFNTTAEPQTWSVIGSTWDIDNWDTVPIEYLKNINLACLYSLFDAVESKQTRDSL